MASLENSANSLVSGRKTVAVPGTAERLVTDSTPCIWVLITAESDNTGLVAVGDADATATALSQQGVLLSATSPPLRVEVNNVNDIWIDAATATEGVSFTYGVA